MNPAARASICFALSILATFAGAAKGWPDGYIVYEDSISPDKHFGIVIPDRETGGDDDPHENANYFADLRTHRLLGKIKNGDYFEGENHAGLTVTWAKDSKFAVVDYEGRFGFGAIHIIEPEKTAFAQAEIGERIQKAVDRVIAKESHETEKSGYVSVEFRIEGTSVRVYGNATSNPKSFDDVKTFRALFLGTYNVATHQWASFNARPLSETEAQTLESGFNQEDTENFVVNPEAFADLQPDAIEPQYYHDKVCFRSAESEFKHFDDQLNDIYQAAHLLLPPAKFENLRNEQRAWVSKRDATGSMPEKIKMTSERIKELQAAAW